MGSVQSDVVCKKCKFKWAFEDYYYKSGEVWVFCARCGYEFSGFMRHDKKRGLKVLAQVKELVAQNKIQEAIEISGNKGWVSSRMVDGEWKDVGISDWSREEQLKTILDERLYGYWHQIDKDGNYVWDIQSKGGFGAYMHRNKRGGGAGGLFPNKWSAKKTIKSMIKGIKSPKRAKEQITYTKKINGKWFMFDARTGQKAELPDNMGYLLWQRRNNGDLKEYKSCNVCNGDGGVKTEGSDANSWKECETCKGEGVIC